MLFLRGLGLRRPLVKSVLREEYTQRVTKRECWILFSQKNSDHVAHLKSLQGEIFHLFQDWVKSRRGAKLKGSPEELFSGAFWTGIKAKELGLIDGLGDMRTIMRERFGENVKFKIFEKKAGFLSRFGLSGKMESGSASALIDNFLDGIEARALWNRFGL